ncbi:MAG: hypothetical protein ACRDD1_02775, partial [Planctomycetia bacterium]
GVGVVDDVALSAVSRRFRLRPLCVEGDWTGSAGVLRLSGFSGPDHRPERPIPPPTDLALEVSLDGEVVDRRPWPVDAVPTPFDVSLDGLAVEPWHARGLGPQNRHAVGLRWLGSDGTVFHEEKRSIGFRRLEPTGAPDAAGLPTRWQCNGVEFAVETVEIGPDSSYRPLLGEDRRKPFEEWSLAPYQAVRFIGHRPPTDALSLCDRAGLLAILDMPEDDPRAINDPSGRAAGAYPRNENATLLSSHPSLAARRIDPSGITPV